MPQPHSTCSIPASVYSTVSWSGMTSRPWRSQSSPVLTTTVRPVAEVRLEAVRELGAADAAGQRDDAASRRHALRSSTHLADPVDRLAVVRRGHVDEDVPEAQVEERPEAVGDLGRRARAKTLPTSASNSSPLWPRAAPGSTRARPSRRVADDDVEADRPLDRRRVAADRRAVLAQDRVRRRATSSSVARRVPRSPYRASVRSVFFGPEPPIRIGRCAWTGRGAHERVVHRVDRPVVA